MIATKGQLVRLTAAARRKPAPYGRANDTRAAKVLCIVYPDQPEGQRGVQLDRPLGESNWQIESDLEEAGEKSSLPSTAK